MEKYKLFLSEELSSDVPEQIKIVPLGNVSSTKGDFIVDESSFKAILKQIAERGNQIVIDYEHQTLKGIQAPAAGWIKNLTLGDDAIIATVDWTEKASEYLANKEYKYLSPVIMVDKNTRKVIGLQSVALTNTPAINNMHKIVASELFEDEELEGEKTMELKKKLMELFGITGDLGDEELLNKITATLKDGEIAKSELALKDGEESGLTKTVETLQLTIAKMEADKVVELALSEGKITPAQKSWAQELALKDKNSFETFMTNTTPVVNFKKVAETPKEIKKELSDEDIATARLIGLSTEDLKKYGLEE